MSRQSETSALGAVIGFIAGVVATGPMTVAMILWHRSLPMRERYPLPPREITMKLAQATGLSDVMTPEMRSAATLAAHFGYGGGAGALYGAIAEEIPAPAIAKGVAAGLALWAVSYFGLMPGAGILKQVTGHPARRNVLMIAAHVVWGAALGIVTELLREETTGAGAKPFSANWLPQRDRKG